MIWTNHLTLSYEIQRFSLLGWQLQVIANHDSGSNHLCSIFNEVADQNSGSNSEKIHIEFLKNKDIMLIPGCHFTCFTENSGSRQYKGMALMLGRSIEKYWRLDRSTTGSKIKTLSSSSKTVTNNFCDFIEIILPSWF